MVVFIVAPVVFAIRVKREEAEKIRRCLAKKRLINPNFMIIEDGDFLMIPIVKQIPEAVDVELPPRDVKKTPYLRIRELCAEQCYNCNPPDYWERIGKVILLPGSWDYEGCNLTKLGEIYARVLNAHTVAIYHHVSGEFREQKISVIWGKRTETIHTENGIKYALDLSRIMFSSGNVNERIRMSSFGDGEIVVDMFAGIGYFTLPLALHARRVYACEKNPFSYNYLLKNIQMNGFDNIVPLLGDNRVVCPRGVADRVVMGYFGTKKFFPYALRILRYGGIIHYHDVVRDDFIIDSLREVASKMGFEIQVLYRHTVKSYAPHLYHRVYDLKVSRG